MNDQVPSTSTDAAGPGVPPLGGIPTAAPLPGRDAQLARAGTNASGAGRRAAPLWAALSFAFLGSIGTGIVTNGIYFIADQRYGFTQVENYLLGLGLGVTYIAGAMLAGPALRHLAARSPLISTRAVLAAAMVALALPCFLPRLASRGGGASAWPVWALVGLYSPLTGVLWPIVEGYISGGRTGAGLRSAIGRFNIAWASALVAAFWGLAIEWDGQRVLESGAAEAIAALGVLHLASMLLLAPLGAEPGRHIHEHHEPHPPVYRQLLVTLRILLPTSYLVLTAVMPCLPFVLRELGVDQLQPFSPRPLSALGLAVGWLTPIASTWLIARLVVFILLERWHGWHGRWSLPVFGGAMLLGGFAVTVLSPRLGALAGAGLAWLIGGLAMLGVGVATIYSGALYYAMEVGNAEVDAGGKHEALIGVGYTAGPLCGLAAAGLVAAGLLPESSFEVAMLALTSVLACAAAAYAGRQAWRLVHPARAAGSGAA